MVSAITLLLAVPERASGHLSQGTKSPRLKGLADSYSFDQRQELRGRGVKEKDS